MSSTINGPVDPICADLSRILRDLKLSGLKDTLPERLVMARTQKMGHAAFLELIFADELAPRDSRSAMLRAQRANLDAAMRLEASEENPEMSYDRILLSDLTSFAFTQAGHAVLLLGPVGVGKTHLATALGHIGNRKRLSMHFTQADKLFTRLRASRLENSLEAELRRIAAVDLLIIDDFAIKKHDATETNDFYEIVVERHRRKSTIISSNREPADWMAMTSDTLLAQSAIDRLTQGAHMLVVEGPSFRQRDSRNRSRPLDEMQGK